MDEIINLVNIEYDRNLLTMEEIIKFGELFETMGDEMSWGKKCHLLTVTNNHQVQSTLKQYFRDLH